jgi:sec-independent protein translocase protein TatA
MPNVSIWEILLLLLVLLLVFGPKRLPEMGRSLGRGMREFRDSIAGKEGPGQEEAQVTPVQAAPLPTAVSGPDSSVPAVETTAPVDGERA